MKKLERFVVYADDQMIGWAFSEAFAREIAYEFERQCENNEDGPYYPEMRIEREETE